MRIAVFDNQQSGGGRRAIYELMRVLRRRGHTLHLYNYSTSAEWFLPLAPLADSTATFHLPETSLPLPRRLPYGPMLGAVALDRRLDAAGRSVARAIDEGRHDLALVQECRYAGSPHLLRHLATRGAFYCGEPKRGLYESISSNQRPAGPEGRRGAGRSARSLYLGSLKRLTDAFWRRVDRANGRSADLVLTCSHYSRELIWRAHGVFAWTSHLGVDAERFRPGDGLRDHAVASVGELVPRKAHDFVIEAVAAIPRHRRPRVLIAANAAWEEERCYVEQLARRLEVDLEIVMNPGDDGLARTYSRAKLLAYPPIMEPFGLVALEAMACETPVVGVAEAGIRESVTPGVGGLLVSRDVSEFSAAIDGLLNDEKLARRLGLQGREAVRGYWSWERACDRLEANLARLPGLSP